jgi:hypothetical protein
MKAYHTLHSYIRPAQAVFEDRQGPGWADQFLSLTRIVLREPMRGIYKDIRITFSPLLMLAGNWSAPRHRAMEEPRAQHGHTMDSLASRTYRACTYPYLELLGEGTASLQSTLLATAYSRSSTVKGSSAAYISAYNAHIGLHFHPYSPRRIT